MRDGAVNYLAKPIDLDELLVTVQQATGMAKSAAPRYREDKVLPPEVIARSPLMAALYQEISLIAPSETRVLITGESGVGKEVVADVIHAWSPRAAGPMTKVNCAAIPETLLEAELFGHEKGSFTGATAQRIGRFESANGGTVFLDEIAEMSPALQAKLLRVTQDGTFQRVGSNREIQTNVRILAASNRNLEEEVKAGTFSRGFVLPAERGGVEHPAVARAARGHFAFGEFVRGGIRPWPRAARRGDGRVPGKLSVAGQRARVAQRDGAGGAVVPERTDFAGAPADARPRCLEGASAAGSRRTGAAGGN